MNEKNILYIVHSYNSFQKDPIEIMAKHFKNVYVLIRYKPIAKVSKLLPINSLKNHAKNVVLDLTNKPKNVHVYSTPLWYLPTQKGYKNLGKKHYRAVLKQIEKHKIKFDIIHCHFTWSAGYVGMKLKEKFGKPLVITGHGYDVYSLPFKDKEWRDKITEVLNSANIITTVSNSNLKKLRKLKIKTPIEVIPNGFNSNLFKPMNKEKCKRELNLPLDKKIVLTVGNLVPIKGQKYLIKAVKEVLKEYPEVLCYVIGGGPLKNKLQTLINEMNLENNVKLMGRKPHNEIPLWMNAADVFVLPSIQESFGAVQIEALACGTPVVATINGGSEYIVTDKNVGLLMESRNPSQLGRGISNALGKRWSSDTIQKAAGKYSFSKLNLSTKNLYESLL